MAETPAQRVFAIPELLENILEQVPQSDESYGPAECIYRLLSVNKAFRDTILGSPALKRAMWITSADGPLEYNDNYPEDVYCNRIWWLLQYCLSQHCMTVKRQSSIGHNEAQAAHAFDIQVHWYAFEDDGPMLCKYALRRFDEFVQTHGEASASWRYIKACASSDAATLYLIWSKDRPKGWRVTNTTLLGDIFDKYSKTMMAVRGYVNGVEIAKQEMRVSINEVADEAKRQSQRDEPGSTPWRMI